MQSKIKVPTDVESSAFGARFFYFLLFSLFYVCVAMYPNKLK